MRTNGSKANGIETTDHTERIRRHGEERGHPARFGKRNTKHMFHAETRRRGGRQTDPRVEQASCLSWMHGKGEGQQDASPTLQAKRLLTTPPKHSLGETKRSIARRERHPRGCNFQHSIFLCLKELRRVHSPFFILNFKASSPTFNRTHGTCLDNLCEAVLAFVLLRAMRTDRHNFQRRWLI